MCTGDTTEPPVETVNSENNKSSAVPSDPLPMKCDQPDAAAAPVSTSGEVESDAPSLNNNNEIEEKEINDNKPDETDVNNSLQTAVDSVEAAAVEKEVESSMTALRKQKNRIMCQCGSANCRKYLF